MSEYDLIVRGGTVVTASDQFPADVGVRGGRIAALAERLHGRRPARFDFRSLSPLFDDADFTLNADEDGGDLRLWTAGVGGPVAMEARASW